MHIKVHLFAETLTTIIHVAMATNMQLLSYCLGNPVHLKPMLWGTLHIQNGLRSPDEASLCFDCSENKRSCGY